MTAPDNPRVIHTAQALVDHEMMIAALPPRGGNAVAQEGGRHAGGAVNVLVAAARAGAHCVHAGSVGTGPSGELIRVVLGAEGVLISSPPVRGLDTGSCIVLVEPDGERTFITGQGAERRISVESLATSRPRPGDAVCVSGYSLQGPTCRPLLEWLGGLPAGVQVVLDPGAPLAGLAAPVREQMLALTTVWTSNALEASALTGLAAWTDSARALADRLPAGAVVIVRDGARGCLVHQDAELHEVPGFPQRAVDTNGAGDTHTGVLLAERLAGAEWHRAARRANAAAAIKVTRQGPTSAPTRAEVDAFLAASGAAG